MNRVRWLSILHVVSLSRKINISLSAFVPKNLVSSRDGFGSPVPRQPAHLHTEAESGAYCVFLGGGRCRFFRVFFVPFPLSLCIECVCVFSSHSFWTSSSLDVPAGVTQEEGHTGFLIHLLSAVRAFIFLARRIQPLLSLVDREVEFCVLTI